MSIIHFEKTVKKQYKIADQYWVDQNYDFALKIYQNIEKDLTPTSSSYDVECNTSSPKLLLNHDQISQDYPKCPDPSGFPQNSKQSNEKPRVKKNIQFLRDKVL